MKQIIGYVIWKDGPKQTIRSKGQWFERKEPIKVYKTEQVAKRYISKGDEVKPVFVEI